MLSRHPSIVRALAASVLFLLYGCGGGDKATMTPGTLAEPARVRSLTGSQPPTFTSSEIVPTLNRRMRAADSILVSDVLDFSWDIPVRGQTTCSGATCTAEWSGQGEYATWEWSIEEISLSRQARIKAVAEHRGVSLYQVADLYEASSEDESESFAIYGGWLDHSHFFVWADFDRRGELSEDVEGISIGQATGTNPLSGSAAWNGVMVGRDVSATPTRGDAIQGDAAITIADFTDPRVDVAFTGIKNLDSGSARGDMTWSGIPLTSGGFGTGSDGNSIQGKFYGANHEEVGGVFERERVIGAFGAKR